MEVKSEVGDPVVVAVSEVNEERWGFHQFPALTRLPDGTILVMYADAADMSETHGEPAPAFVSRDSGQTWQSYQGDPQPVRPHFTISSVFDGEYLIMPSHHYLDIAGTDITMPEPIAEADAYGIVRTYRTADAPRKVQDYFRRVPAKRMISSTQEWRADTVEYDLRDHLFWKRDSSTMLPRTFFERSLLKFGNELLYADYRVRYLMRDGRAAAKGGSHLMVSTDNGRFFSRRATIAVDPQGNDLMGEPHLSPTTAGNLVCVLRKTDQEQKPMIITWSNDHGHTWTPPEELFEFGVWPCLQLMDNGIMVLSYGRPGVHLRFAADGSGHEWSEPVTIIEGDHADRTGHSCGYTSLLALSKSTFLIAYSDFLHVDEDGNRRKAILVRRISIES